MEQKRQTFKCAPLPFQGQKRHFVGEVARLLEKHNRKEEVKVVVDLFGGSGLLAHTAKRVLPDARVIFNDFDGFHIRLLNVAKTNRLLADLRVILAGYERHTLLKGDIRAEVLQRVEREAKTGYVDYITLSSSLLFSSKYVLDFTELSKAGIYNNVRQSDFDVNPGDYLAGLEIHSTDYQNLFAQFRDTPGVVFLVDPPYLSTDTKTYNSDKYWTLRDYLDVLKVLKGTRYIYFTSNKSALPELGRWLGENVGMGNPFDGAELRTRTNHVNTQACYEDMMLYKLCA